MSKTTKYIRLFFYTFIFLTLFLPANISAKQFTVVIDAGHGGRDSGAKGSFSYEKNLNLSVSLQVGKMIEDNLPDVKVVYTRKKDVFLTLQERADIVNKNNADVFLCIHTNANKNSSARGTETFTLRTSGSRTQGNLEVAMRENSVMLLEDDYKTRYQGFDPRSVESYIMFDFMQDKYLDGSVKLASAIQQQFVRIGRYDRGVQQAGFWVLYQSACPSVLIEMGFISNKTEEQYLNSEEGMNNISNSIYRAFLNYKKEFDKKSGKNNNFKEIDDDNFSTIENAIETPKEKLNEPTIVNEKNTADKNTENAKKDIAVTEKKTDKNQIVYKVQILAIKEKIKEGDSQLKGLKNVQRYHESGLYKYTYGEFNSQQEANQARKKIANKFPHAFIIKFKDGKRLAEK